MVQIKKEGVRKMEKEITIESPAMLKMWLQFNSLQMKISENEARILLDYMEGHDYSLLVREDTLMRMDLGEENGEIEPYDIDDVIDIVCEWNYELLHDAKEGMEHPKNFLDYCNYSDTYKALKEDETVLDALFEQTRYGRWAKDTVHTILEKSDAKGLTDMEHIERKQEPPKAEKEQGKVR